MTVIFCPLSDGGVLIEGAAYPIADGGRERAFFGFVDTAEDSRDYMREVPDGADGAKRAAGSSKQDGTADGRRPAL